MVGRVGNLLVLEGELLVFRLVGVHALEATLHLSYGCFLLHLLLLDQLLNLLSGAVLNRMLRLLSRLTDRPRVDSISPLGSHRLRAVVRLVEGGDRLAFDRCLTTWADFDVVYPKHVELVCSSHLGLLVHQRNFLKALLALLG